MIFPDEQVEGEFIVKSIGESAVPVVISCAEFRSAMDEFGGMCESPIEEFLGVALLSTFREYGYEISVLPPNNLLEAETSYTLVPQFNWGGIYRSDFAVVDVRTGLATLIECDGRDFHSSSDQLIHDGRKDEKGAELGMPTLRFTGSEINKNAKLCAQRVLFNVIKTA